MFLDLNWDPGVATATGFSHGSIFTFLSTGTLLPGALDEFGGCSFTPYGVAPEWVRIGYLSVTASALGTVTYDLNPSTSGVSIFGHGTVPWGTIYLDMLPTEHSPDCNGNGIPDIDDILAGSSADCDLDGVPDECQVDSDGDGVIDPCDGCPADPAKTDPGLCGCGVADTDSDGDTWPDCVDNCPLLANPGQADCDADGIGDACCGEPDCNENGVPDSCDIAAGASIDANGNGIPDECEAGLRGDLNCDGSVNVFDIDPFVRALTDPPGYEQAYPHCDIMLADANCDGLVNAFDIDPFVLCLTGGGCPPCP